MLFKPYGYLSQFVGEMKKKKYLGDFFDFPVGTMSIGRLDEDSEGLLLLTTDGKMSEFIRGKHIEKEYYAQVDGLITDEAVAALNQSVAIVDRSITYHTKPGKAFRLENTPDLPARSRKIRDERHGPTSWVSIVISEGKYRQIRKMTATVGFPTLRLVRVRIGNIHVGHLEPGEVVEISEEFMRAAG